MSEQLSQPKASDDHVEELDHSDVPSTPRWAKVVGIAAAILIPLMFVVLHLTGAVGPGAH
jgi:hypothetical protein